MTGRTHLLGGIASLWLLVPVLTSPPELGPLALCAMLGALLPDLDAADSLAARLSVGPFRPLALPAAALHRALGHRGPAHSLLGLGAAGLLLAVPLGLWLHAGEPAAALLLGYASHLALDACTKTGVPLLYPDRRRRHLLLPAGLRVTTGSAEEGIAFALLAAGALWLLLPPLLLPAAGPG